MQTAAGHLTIDEVVSKLSVDSRTALKDPVEHFGRTHFLGKMRYVSGSAVCSVWRCANLKMFVF